MSRVAKVPVTVPSGVNVSLDGQNLSVKGPRGQLSQGIHPDVRLSQEDGALRIAPKRESKEAWAMAGTARSLVNNMIVGNAIRIERIAASGLE